jgi:hypothetical protein
MDAASLDAQSVSDPIFHLVEYHQWETGDHVWKLHLSEMMNRASLQ